MDLQMHQYCRRLYGQTWHEIRKAVLERDSYKCIECGCEVKEGKCHIHHRLPLSEGGTNHIDNLETRCVDHHKDKHPFMKYIL